MKMVLLGKVGVSPERDFLGTTKASADIQCSGGFLNMSGGKS